MKIHPIVKEMAEGIKSLNPKIDIEYGIIMYSIFGALYEYKEV